MIGTNRGSGSVRRLSQSDIKGIAYAFAPGLTDEDSDSLAEASVRNTLKGTPASDGYVQAYAVALVIRPVLKASLEKGETMTVFLPKAVLKWRSVAGK
jgi:hypothetical protein